ncbi:MAG: daunorubicin resistance transporter ATP-binding subunit [Actinomycetia bacterium]|nr:daunorubicin resistance transporter ATP-binding subunit [Actinomycetes bacterium]
MVPEATDAAAVHPPASPPVTAITGDEVIRCIGLTKQFPGRGGAPSVMAVDHLDLAVRRGEIFGLLGPNGAGKTTTVGMLTTRVIPTSGQALVGDIDVVAEPALAKQLIGVVPQVNTLDRSLTVFENLYFHGRYFGMGAKASRAAANELLERFKLADRAKADTLTLSGGMAQRVMVARAILHRPAILFLDEPTAGLDPQSRIALWEVVQDLHAQGQTILLTTHYMEEADQLCDRVAIMDHGKILALDTAEGLKASIGADTEIGLQADGDLDALARVLESGDTVTRTQVTGDVLRAYLRGSARGALPRLIARADDAGYSITDVSVTEPTLETVFISLTGKELRE